VQYDTSSEAELLAPRVHERAAAATAGREWRGVVESLRGRGIGRGVREQDRGAFLRRSVEKALADPDGWAELVGRIAARLREMKAARAG
jgi:hypothetical protein